MCKSNWTVFNSKLLETWPLRLWHDISKTPNEVCCNMFKCQYPAHKSMKAKNCVNNQYISSTVAYEINQWFSSAATSFNILVASKCCNNCQLFAYLDLKSKPQFI